MSNRKSRRVPNSSAYMGSGNKTSAFNQKPRKPFQEVAEVYKKAIQKNRKIQTLNQPFVS
ncbi:MAG: hypothetical protein RIC95_05335 [Vicingaceae bacterium]